MARVDLPRNVHGITHVEKARRPEAALGRIASSRLPDASSTM